MSDPQIEGMGEGEYTPEGFLRGWNAGNRFAHQAYLALEQRGEKLIGRHHVLPAKTLRACWEWTYGIDTLYDRVHDDDIDVFIPQVMYALCDGALQTLCVWPQLIPTALPAVGAIRPSSRRTVVVLPAPFGPNRANNAPAGTSNDTWSTATRPSNARVSP